MQRQKFVTNKLSKASICRMVLNHLREVNGWSDAVSDSQKEDEHEDFLRCCPADDMNRLLSTKQYVKWGKALMLLDWGVDLHDLINAHAYSLNLNLDDFDESIIDNFDEINGLKEEMKDLDQKKAEINKRISQLYKEMFGMKYTFTKD